MERPDGLVLPQPPKPVGAYRPAMVFGELAFLSSFGPRDAEGAPIPGMVGRDFDIAGARLMARNAGTSILSVLQDTLGSLDRVRQVLKVTGMVWAAPGFSQHPQVIDGCSQLLHEVLGERGVHARAAFGVASLPFDAPVSIDCICRIEP
jgi:enamine deaminase RidA (YjgF/YER057c/UK114 family)